LLFLYKNTNLILLFQNVANFALLFDNHNFYTLFTTMHNINELQSIYKQYAAQQQFLKQPDSLYQPINYLLALGGKSMRPTLVLLACNLFSNNLQNCLPQAYAVELFHNFSLMHDDIMDNSPLRRGQPTVHIRYNQNTAILSGDVMLVYAYQYIAQTEPHLLPQILTIFTRTAVEVCEGQQLDMDMSAAFTASVDDYLEMIRLKTAVLLQASLQIGALIGGATTQQAEMLGQFGLYLGISFQLQDDFLDTFGQSAQVGKQIGGDILENKKTFLWLKSLELADENQLAQLKKSTLIPTHTEQTANEKIQLVTQLYEQLNIPEYSQMLAKNYHQQAINCLKNTNLSEDKLIYLEHFAANLLNRQS
jgi:geranylgeranyl diphosphate synthase, type II